MQVVEGGIGRQIRLDVSHERIRDWIGFKITKTHINPKQNFEVLNSNLNVSFLPIILSNIDVT